MVTKRTVVTRQLFSNIHWSHENGGLGRASQLKKPRTCLDLNSALIFYLKQLYKMHVYPVLNTLNNYTENKPQIWNNYITSVFHWNVTIWLVMKWSHDYKRDVSHPNETQIRTCTCLHDDVRCKQSRA